MRRCAKFEARANRGEEKILLLWRNPSTSRFSPAVHARESDAPAPDSTPFENDIIGLGANFRTRPLLNRNVFAARSRERAMNGGPLLFLSAAVSEAGKVDHHKNSRGA